MKIILSRKGFDSSAGGCPNPIFPDGSMLALPIPDVNSSIRYQDISYSYGNKQHSLSSLVENLTSGKITAEQGAHLDPDMLHDALAFRSDLWRPVLGQAGAAQGHLRKQEVGCGDVFLYWGLFRKVINWGSVRHPIWRFDAESSPIHAMWGWMSIDDVYPVENIKQNPDLSWLNYHPHCNGPPEKNNALYLSANTLSLNQENLAGAGVFKCFSDDLQLSYVDAQLNPTRKPSLWRLPAWMYPNANKTALTYHSNMARWSPLDTHACLLQSAARGQEFVLDTDSYPESKAWLIHLIKHHGR